MSFAATGTFLASYGAAIVATVGAAVSAYATYESSQTQKKVAQHNADIAEIQAQDAKKRGDQKSDEARRQGDALLGRQRAAFSARGLDLNDGSTADLLDETSFFSIADQTTARNNAAKEAWTRRAGKSNFEAEALSINPNAAAFNSLLGSSGQVAERWRIAYKGGGG